MIARDWASNRLALGEVDIAAAAPVAQPLAIINSIWSGASAQSLLANLFCKRHSEIHPWT
jgi:hypothetical protein